MSRVQLSARCLKTNASAFVAANRYGWGRMFQRCTVMELLAADKEELCSYLVLKAEEFYRVHRTKFISEIGYAAIA